jgi:hypothetical protein
VVGVGEPVVRAGLVDGLAQLAGELRQFVVGDAGIRVAGARPPATTLVSMTCWRWCSWPMAERVP